MTSLFPEIKDQPTRVDAKLDIGAELSAARTQADLSTEEVARSLHLSPHHIRALEANNYDAMPASTFVRGYIRAYAKLLALDGDQLVAVFDAIGATDPELVSTTGGHYDQIDSTHPWMVWASLGMAFLFLLLLAGWWQSLSDQAQTETDETASNNESVAELDLSNQSLLPSEDDLSATQTPGSFLLNQPVGEAPISDASLNEPLAPSSNVQATNSSAQTSSTPPISGQLNQSETAAVVENIAAEEPEVPEPSKTQTEQEQGFVPEIPAEMPQITPQSSIPEDSDQLVLITENETWIEVRDAEERVLMYSLYTNRVPLRLRGRAPFYVFLGNAPAVKAAVNATAVDLSTYIRSNRTARFVIDETGVRRP